MSSNLSRTEGESVEHTYAVSVKKIFPLGWTLTSLKELNCRPKKLLRRMVTLYGGVGLTRAMEGGREPRPEVARRMLEW